MLAQEDPRGYRRTGPPRADRWTWLVSTEFRAVTMRSRRSPASVLTLTGPLAGESRGSVDDDGAWLTAEPGRTIEDARMLPSPTAMTASAATAAGANRSERRRRTREIATGCSSRSSGAARSSPVKRVTEAR